MVMSLFGSLFGSKAASDGLFSEASKYKSHHEQQEPAEEPTTYTVESKDSKKRKSGKRAAETASTDSKGEAAGGAGALKLQAGIAAAKVAQTAADDDGTLVKSRKRRKFDKEDKHSKKGSKKAAGTSPTAVVQHQQNGAAHEQPCEQQGADLQARRKHKKHRTSTLQGCPQPQAGTAAPAQQQDGAAAETAEDVITVPASLAASQHHRLSPEEEAEKLSRTVFVGNLPVDIERKQLTRLFSTYGEVESVRLRSVPLDLESKKKLPRKAAVIKGVVSSDRGGTNAYVVFKDAAAAAAALAANMTEVAGRHIRVDRAAPPSAARADGAAAGAGSSNVLYDPVRSVFVGNLDFKITEEDLIRTFSNGDLQPELAAAVEAVRVVRDPETNLGKGIAYVLFKTKAAARAALQLDEQKLGKRAMRVTRVNRRASPAAANQQRSPSAAAGGAKRLNDIHSNVQKTPGFKQASGVKRFTGANNNKRFGSGVAADWQGLRTKGKGAGFRSAGRVSKPSGERSGNFSGGSKPAFGGTAGHHRGKAKAGSKGSSSSKSGGKRPAVAARKEKVKAAAKRFKAAKQ